MPSPVNCTPSPWAPVSKAARGRTPMAGWVVAQGTAPKLAPERISVIDVDDRVTPLPESLIEVSRWVSDYYQCPMHDAGLGGPRRRETWTGRSSTAIGLGPPPPTRSSPPATPNFEVLHNTLADLPESALLEVPGSKPVPLQALERAGLLRSMAVEAIRGTDIPGGLDSTSRLSHR